MSWFRTKNKPDNQAPAIQISEKYGVRYLHLGSDTVQSAMRIADPIELVLPYTHCMMGFALFAWRPKIITVIGLGGASLPKFIYKHMPKSIVESVELHPEVVAVAHHSFDFPDDPIRLPVTIGDGGAFVAAKEDHADVLMVDGFGSHKLADNLCSDAFYHAAKRALTENGIMVVNLWRSSPQFHMLVSRISAIFEQRILLLPDYKHGNTIVLAFAKAQDDPRWRSLEARASQLESEMGLPFKMLVERLRDENTHSEDNLLI